jgi:hypothetical protein
MPVPVGVCALDVPAIHLGVKFVGFTADETPCIFLTVRE